MLRFSIADTSHARRTALRDALLRCATEAHLGNISVIGFSSLEELAASCAHECPGFYDLALCYIKEYPTPKTMQTDNPFDQIRAIMASQPHLHVVLVSSHAEIARAAYELGAGFVMLPSSHDIMRKVLSEPFALASKRRQARLALKSAAKVDTMSLDDIQFVESSKRGPVIHLSTGKTLATRGTLRALCDKLSAIAHASDNRTLVVDTGQTPGMRHPFIMAGNSFIVNLDNVRASGKGALVFANGETIIVPTRKRKEVEAALSAYRAR